jgi:hypothetical protein
MHNHHGLITRKVLESESRTSDSMSKPKKQRFSIIKAVKANARARIGTPPPERVLPDPKQKIAAKPKYKPTLADLLASSGEDR